jgi:hypothetical protein
MCNCRKEKVVKDEYGRLYYVKGGNREYVEESHNNSYNNIDWGDWKIEKNNFVNEDFIQLVIKKGVNLIHELNQTILKTTDIEEQNRLFELLGNLTVDFQRYTSSIVNENEE